MNFNDDKGKKIIEVKKNIYIYIYIYTVKPFV